jgi:23S rRNA pseudouridine2605 synthase
VPLARALSKLGVFSRRVAIDAILAGRVEVDGARVLDPGRAVSPEQSRIAVDDQPVGRARSRTIALNKPRGVVTTRRDPEGRTTVYDVLGDVGSWLAPVGRLDAATSGLLLLTNDTRLAAWLTDPASAVPRVYTVTVRGRVPEEACRRLEDGLVDRGERLRAVKVTIRKASSRETHLVVELAEGRYREVRRLFAAIGHEVTALSRIAIGGLRLGDLAPGKWRELSLAEIQKLRR